MSIRSLKTKKLSVVVPTYNCAQKLEKCLNSVSWAHEIIIVDMGSIDNTREVAENYGARVFVRLPKDGNFDWNRKFGMNLATGDWILKIDSDEVLSTALQEEIKKFLRSQDEGSLDGFNLYNRLFWFGKQIKHGCVKPKSHELRLVRNHKWQYNPYRYHQLLTVTGKVGFFKNNYDHYNYDSVSEFVEKTNKYTNLDSRILASERKTNNWIAVFPFGTFLKLFIWRGGILDRSIGFTSSFLFAMYNFILRVKIWERQKVLF